MLTARIDSAIDTQAMRSKRALLVGVGAAAGIGTDLVRCNLGEIDVMDPDCVGPENLCRQGHFHDQIGMPKVDASKREMLRINPDVKVRAFQESVTRFTDEEALEQFSGIDLFIAATDSHQAQARVNQLALMHNKPVVFAGLYRGGRAGDIEFWKPGMPSCYRCYFPSRYEAFAREAVDPPSDGATIVDVKIFDGIAAQICLGLLTEGADNRFGKLIAALGNRTFLQVKIDPDWTLGGSDPVRKYLGIPDGNTGYFSFCTVARTDPDAGGSCPDCVKYRKDTISK
jgi:sulfur carrier protein ThiS adenylyltransferase